jgi:hypothetical protein
VVYGLGTGLALWAAASLFQSVSGSPEETDSIPLHLSDAGELAQRPERPVPWALPNAVGRGVLSLLSAPPGGGKGWWTWGLLRAVQDGGTFFGLPAHRLTHRPWWWAWGRGRPARVLWVTEEGEQTFARAARRFGIAPGLVKTLRRDQVPAGLPWEELVRLVRRRAWRERCALVIFDTVRAWCPQAEQSPEAANAVMQTVRKELTGPGLAVLFVHHDTKQGGTFGRGVSGTYALVGAVDILIELRRVSDDPADPRRRMVTSRRYEPMDITATLEGHRYRVGGESESAVGDQPRASVPPLDRAAYQAYLTSPEWLARRAAALERAGGRCERCGAGEPAEVHHLTYEHLGDERPEDLEAVCRPCHRRAHPAEPAAAGSASRGNLPAHVRGTLARLKRLGREIETDELLKLEKGSRNALLARLRVLEGAGLAAYRGKGVRNDPQRWRAL